MQLTDFLPTTRKELELRGWDEVDVILFSADAYVDHPSFGAAIITRLLEDAGYKVAFIATEQTALRCVNWGAFLSPNL